MTYEVLEKLEEAFKYGSTDEEACAYADIAESTLYKYQEKNPEFTERKAQLKELPIFTARKSVVDRLSKNPELALKYLERKKKDEFSLRTESQVDVNIDPRKEILEQYLGGTDDRKAEEA